MMPPHVRRWWWGTTQRAGAKAALHPPRRCRSSPGGQPSPAVLLPKGPPPRAHGAGARAARVHRMDGGRPPPVRPPPRRGAGRRAAGGDGRGRPARSRIPAAAAAAHGGCGCGRAAAESCPVCGQGEYRGGFSRGAAGACRGRAGGVGERLLCVEGWWRDGLFFFARVRLGRGVVAGGVRERQAWIGLAGGRRADQAWGGDGGMVAAGGGWGDGGGCACPDGGSWGRGAVTGQDSRASVQQTRGGGGPAGGQAGGAAAGEARQGRRAAA